MQDNFITKLLELKVDNRKTTVKTYDEKIIIQTQLKQKGIRKCRNCNCKTHILDYRERRIKEIPIAGKQTIIKLKVIRYICPKCKKTYQKEPEFTQKHSRMTTRLMFKLVHEYSKMKTLKQISEEYKVGPNTILRVLDQVKPSRKELGKVLAIDEFKGDSGKEKYQTSIADPERKKLIDILPNRKLDDLNKYFKTIPLKEKEKVKIFVSDMSQTWRNIKKIHFKESTHVIDKYHFVRQITWAFENIRKSERKQMTREEGKYFYNSRRLLQKSPDKVTEEESIRIANMLIRNERIRKAYKLKERFYNYVMKSMSKEEALYRIENWIALAKEDKDPYWTQAIRAFSNWKEEIANSFDHAHTNGYLEGKHNKIKQIKRITCTMPNFENFRRKILLMG